MDLQVRLRSNEDGSAVAELVNRDDLIDFLQQAAAREIHQDEGPLVKSYDPAEPEYTGAPPETLNIAGVSAPKPPSVEHLKAEFSDDERRKLRRWGRVPREILIPAGAIKKDFTAEVIMGELFKVLPEHRTLDIQIVILEPMKEEEL